jgi:hypothetical protein
MLSLTTTALLIFTNNFLVDIGLSLLTLITMYRPPQYRAMDKKAEPTSMTSGLTDRVSVISSAKVVPDHNTGFKSPRIVGGYSWIDDGEEFIIAVPGEHWTLGTLLIVSLMSGLPDVWVGGQGVVGQLEPDIATEDYLEYSDRKLNLGCISS